MFKQYLYRRKLKNAREDLQTIFDHADKKRSFHPDGGIRDIEDFMTTREKRVFIEVKQEEWALSKLLGQTPQWGTARMLYVNEEDEVIPASTNVKYNRSSKVTWELDEELGGYVMVRDGVRKHEKRWVMDNGEPVMEADGTTHVWEDYVPVSGTEMFIRQGWGRDEAWHEACDQWHAAETPEEKQEVVDKFKEENPKWSL